MDSFEINSCDFDGCSEIAKKHVHYGHKYGGSYLASDGIGLEIPRYSDVRDFCDEHLASVTTIHRDANVYEVGNCPNNCNNK